MATANQTEVAPNEGSEPGTAPVPAGPDAPVRWTGSEAPELEIPLAYPRRCLTALPPGLPLPLVVPETLTGRRWNFVEKTCRKRVRATVPPDAWKEYAESVHPLVHAFFSRQFLAALERLPSGHELNDPALQVMIRYGVDASTGKPTELRFVRSSGVEVFDLGALEALTASFPHPIPAKMKVAKPVLEFEWTFVRHPLFACSTAFMRPIE